MRYLFVALVCVAIGACGGGGGGGGVVITTPTTTVMVFMAADNNLEEVALEDLNEMEAVGSSADVNIVVQVDTVASTTMRLRVLQDTDPVNVTSPTLQDLGETNTASRTAITAFVAWAVQSFPADRYVLILWDHGGGWPGYATDDTSTAPPIPAEDLRQALQDIQAQAGIQRLDMLGFDACLMATLEIAHELAPFARYLVASEEIEPGQGWPYDDILGPLVANPSTSIRDFAASIPPAYQFATTTSGEGDWTTLSAIDLDRVPALVAAFEAFADELLAAGVAVHYEALGRARFQTEKYNTPERDAVDLGDLATKVAAAAGIPASVVTAATTLTNALANAVVSKDQGPVHAEASGLSVYFGPGPVDPNYLSLALAVDTSWDEFLDTFALVSAADQTAPTITIDQSSNLVDPTAANPATVDVTITGNDAIDLQTWIARDLGGGVADILGAVSQDEAQPGQTRLTWDGNLLALTDGVRVSELPLFPVEPGACNVALGFTRYRPTVLSLDLNLLMLVKCATGEILGFFEVVTIGGRTVIGAVEPQPGSEMEVLFIRLDVNAGTTTLVPGITLTLPAGAESLTVTSGPAVSGNYGLLTVVRDIAGNLGADGVDVTVP